MSSSRYRAIKAYKNELFLSSPDARSLRILAEYLEPESRFKEFDVRDTIVVFGSARFLSKEAAEEALEQGPKVPARRPWLDGARRVHYAGEPAKQ